MNDAIEKRFLELVRQARRAAAPEMDVSDAVLARISRPPAGSLRPVAALASLSAVAAAAVIVLSVRAWSGFSDPMTGLLCSIDIVVTP